MAMEGLDNLLNNLAKEVKGVEARGQAGVTEAALWVRGESQRLAPVVTGNLQNSAFIVFPGGGDTAARFSGEQADQMRAQHQGVTGQSRARVTAKRQPVAEVGFSAVYARRTHENPRAGKTGGESPSGKKYESEVLPSGRKSTRKVFATSGQWKFLETPLKKTSTINRIIKNRIQIK